MDLEKLQVPAPGIDREKIKIAVTGAIYLAAAAKLVKKLKEKSECRET